MHWSPVSNAIAPCSLTIATDHLDTRSVLVHTACDHTFHRECLLTWIANSEHMNHSCPSCRYTPLYNVELYNVLFAYHPDHNNSNVVTTVTGADEESPPSAAVSATATTNNPDDAIAMQYRLVYWVLLALLLQMIVMSGLIYSMGEPTSAMADIAEPPLNLPTTSCEDVIIPFDQFEPRDEEFCVKSVMQGSCTICSIMTQIECLCYCRDELRVTGIRYTESSKCCKCFKT
jgi:Ring finger domain